MHGTWVLSPEAHHAPHPSWCGGCGTASSVRSASCARNARSACAHLDAHAVPVNRREEPFRNPPPGRWPRRWRPRARHTRCHGCWHGLSAGGKVGGRQGGRWMARHFARNHTTRAAHDFPPTKIPTLPRSPFGRTIMFFNDFYSVEKHVMRSRERR